MIVHIRNEWGKTHPGRMFSFHWKTLAETLLRETLKSEGCPFDAEAELLLVGEEEIREYNRSFRGIDRATDVLSFPAVEYASPAGFTGLCEGDPDSFDPENGCLMLGDVVLCIDRVKKQALEYGHSEKREYAFLITHSVLHLIGYDHMADPEAKLMEEKQERILRALNITKGV